jgi:hypothetical protein
MKGRKGRRRDGLLELDEVEARLKPFERRYLGCGQFRSTRSSARTAAPTRSRATSARSTTGAATGCAHWRLLSPTAAFRRSWR